MTPLDAEVLVVGAGPAGASLAALLAERGHDVLLVDRHHFPRRKACGECLNPGGIAALERMGLRGAVEATGPVALSGWSLVTPRGRAGWAGFPDPFVAWGIDRATFDLAILNEARRRGARVVEGVRVQGVDPGTSDGSGRAWGVAAGPDGGRRVEFRAELIVGADGLRSVVARDAGAVERMGRARWKPRPPRLRKASLTWRIRGRGPDRSYGRLLLGGDMTVGLAPTPVSGGSDAWSGARRVRGDAGNGARDDSEDDARNDDAWNATLVVDSARAGRGLRSAGWSWLEAGLRTLAPDWTEAPRPEGDPVASGPFDRPGRRVRAGRVLLVGDSAGYYDPLTGQGIFRALRGAELAAEAIGRALGSGRAASRHADRLAREFRSGTAVQHLIEACVRRPALRESAISIVARSPATGRALARIVGDMRGLHAHD